MLRKYGIKSRRGKSGGDDGGSAVDDKGSKLSEGGDGKDKKKKRRKKSKLGKCSAIKLLTVRLQSKDWTLRCKEAIIKEPSGKNLPRSRCPP